MDGPKMSVDFTAISDESNETVLKAEIQQLKQRIRQLEGQQPRYRDFFADAEKSGFKEHHGIPMGTWVWDTRTNDVQWSPDLFHILGYDAEKDRASVDNYLAAIHPEDRPKLQRAVEIAMKEGVANRFSVRILWPDGQCRYIQSEGMVLRNDEGQVIRMLGFILDVTEYTLQSESTQRTQQLLHEAQLLAKVGSWIWNVDEGWMEFSEGAWRLVDMEPISRISLMKSLEMIHPDDVDRVRQSAQQVVSSNFLEEIELEYRVVTSKGTIRQVLQRSRDLPRLPGSPRYRLGTVLDVTQARKAEDQIRRSVQLLDEAQTLGKTGHWVWDLESGRLQLSASLSDLVGVPDKTEIGIQDVIQMIHPEDKAKVGQSIQSVGSNGGESSLEFRIVLKDGTIRNIVQRSRPYESPVLTNGKARLGTMVDVTDLRRAEARSRQSQFIAESALKMAKAGSWLWNPKSHDMFWSDELYQLTGIKHGTPMTWQSIQELILPEDALEFTRNKESVLSGKGQEKALFRIRRPDTGEIRYFEMQGQWKDHVDEDGKIFLGINLDVTERHHQEEAKRQAQKLEAIGRLAGGVAHDFNNLLTVMLGHAEELNLQKPNERLQQILKAGSLGAALTQRLLAFSRQAVVRMQSVSLDQVIQSMSELLERLLGEDITIEFELHTQDAQVLADVGQLEQIILNLAINARDAMPEGGRLRIVTSVVNRIPTEAVPKPKNESTQAHSNSPFVMLSVEDNGSGMSGGVIAHLFEPFFTTKEIGKGTGLGLSTILSILTECHGRILVESKEGQGTRFEVYWPKVEAREKSNPIQPISSLPQEELTKGIVAVVEDNPELRRLLVEMLESGGYEAVSFPSANDAVEYPPDSIGKLRVLVTDMVMPGMHGQIVAQRMRMHQPELPVLFISGYPRMDVEENLKGGFLQKPFSRGQFLEAIGALIVAKGRAILG